MVLIDRASPERGYEHRRAHTFFAAKVGRVGFRYREGHMWGFLWSGNATRRAKADLVTISDKLG